jgi:phosphoglycerate kinase
MLSKKLSIDKIAKEIYNKKILLRVDFNVPTKDGKVIDNTRIKESMTTIKFILDKKPQNLIIMSHLGRPDGQPNQKYSLKPIVSEIEKLLNKEISFLPECVGPEIEKEVHSRKDSHVFLLENLRFHPEEEGSHLDKDGQKVKEPKENIAKFRESLTRLGDIYVNDAFGTCHRAHSSIVGVNLPLRASGFLLKKELDYFAKVLENPEKPLTVIMGGAKVKDKIAIITNLLDKVDHMIITGGMAFTFLKHVKGMKIGRSIFDEEGFKLVESIMEKAKKKEVQIHFPEDFVIAKEIKDFVQTSTVDVTEGIPDDYFGIDVGPKSSNKFENIINDSRTIFLNGACGIFEINVGRSGSEKMVKVNLKNKKGHHKSNNKIRSYISLWRRRHNKFS